MFSREERFHCSDQHGLGLFALQPTCLAQGQNSLRPSLATFAHRAQALFTPEHSEAQHPFGVVVRRGNAIVLKEQPQVSHLAAQPASQLSGIVISVGVLGNQANETRIKHAPLAHRGRRFRHATQSLQLLSRPGSAARYFLGSSFGVRLGLTDEMRQATLPQADSGSIHAVAVADNDACPVLDQRFEGGLGASGVGHEQRGPGTITLDLRVFRS